MPSAACASTTPPATWLIESWKLIQICVHPRKPAAKHMHTFSPGDDLIFQLESGFGLLRVLAVEGEGSETIWHLLAYDEFFPDVESAELALAQATPLPIRQPH